MNPPILIISKFVINYRTNRIYYDGQRLTLRNKLFKLLEHLLINQGVTLTRNELLTQVWDMNSLLNTNTVDVHISQLRTILKKLSCEYQINTVYCQGYIFEIDNKRPF